MKTFREHSLQEVKKPKGIDNGLEMERVIEAAAGGRPYKAGTAGAPGNTVVDAAGPKIIKDNNLKGKWKKPGNQPYSKDWGRRLKQYGGTKSDSTPKTDFILGRKNISLKTISKKSTSAFITNSNRPEANVIFHYACVKSGINRSPKLKAEVDKMKKDYFEKMHFNKVSDVKAHRRDDIKSAAVINQFKGKKQNKKDKAQFPNLPDGKLEGRVSKQAMKIEKELQDKLQDLMNSSDKFALEYVREGMTGLNKFGKGKDGCARYCLVTNTQGVSVMHDLFKDDAYIQKLARQVKPTIRLFGEIKNGKTQFRHMWAASIKFLETELKNISEQADILTEGALLDFISNAWNKAIRYMERAWDAAMKWIGNSIDRLLEYFGFSVQATFNNSVRF
jgi:hypothetical protein